jgi:hypothetical protein
MLGGSDPYQACLSKESRGERDHMTDLVGSSATARQLSQERVVFAHRMREPSI